MYADAGLYMRSRTLVCVTQEPTHVRSRIIGIVAFAPMDRMRVHAQVHMNVHWRASIHTYTHTKKTHAYICTSMYTYVCTFIRTYTGMQHAGACYRCHQRIGPWICEATSGQGLLCVGNIQVPECIHARLRKRPCVRVRVFVCVRARSHVFCF